MMCMAGHGHSECIVSGGGVVVLWHLQPQCIPVARERGEGCRGVGS